MEAKNILVVEDDDIQREEVSNVLRAAGHTVRTAADGREALQCLRTGPMPDMILLDMMIQSPGCDGWTFLQLIRQMPRLSTIPVLIVTGLGVATSEWAQSLGADGVLKKPFDISTLLAEVEGEMTLAG